PLVGRTGPGGGLDSRPHRDGLHAWPGGGPAGRATSRVRLLVSALASMLLLLGRPPVGEAHAALVSSVPPARSTVTTPPSRLTLTFNERLQPAYARVSASGAAGAQGGPE